MNRKLFSTASSLTAVWLSIGISALAQPVSEPAKVLHALFAAEWDYDMEHNPTRASALGDRRWNDRWEDVSLAAIKKDYEHQLDVLARLKQINRTQFSTKDQFNYDLFQKQYELAVEEYPFRWYLVPLNQREGIQTADELADSLRFETEKDYQDWLARLLAFPAYMEQTVALMREGIGARLVLPKIVMQRVPAQIAKQITDNPTASPFYKPFKNFPRTFSDQEREKLSKAAQAAIADGVVPAFRKFKQFFGEEYLPACFNDVGAWQMPQGEKMYAFFVRKFTTTPLSPKEIHEIGRWEVERIRDEMQAVMDKVGFKGTRSDFFNFLRTDPKFYYPTSEALLEGCRALAKRIDPQLVKVFKTMPRMPYGVEPIPDKIAPDTTMAYYRPPADDGSRAGSFFMNLYKPETRGKYELMALALHEAVPGHHFQIALAMEQGQLPNFRRHAQYTAFVEGWGLYAESLGEEMGLYDDPYSKFGQLTYEMWRAVRLVVDTGIHHLHWDRQKAIDFFKENAAKSENDIINEIDRYIAWPGQALAYKMGELKIKELRARAGRELAEKFNLKEFHDVVLLSGAVPLDILERQVKEWIEARRLRP